MDDRTLEHRRRYKRFLLSVSDFFEASDALNTIALMKGGQVKIFSVGLGIAPKIRSALLTQAVVAYSRPFLESKGDEALKRLSPAMLGMQLDDAAKKQHRRILGLRSKVVAHSDYELRQAGSLAPGVGFGATALMYLDTIDFRLFRSLTAHAVAMTMKRLGALEKRHGSAMFDPPPPRDARVRLPG